MNGDLTGADLSMCDGLENIKCLEGINLDGVNFNRKLYKRTSLIEPIEYEDLEPYDIFEDYGDGIYPITKKQYIDFMKGKCIRMKFTRQIDIYILKKKGIYSFISCSSKGNLCSLDRGNMKLLEKKDIEYYYEHLDTMVDCFKKVPIEIEHGILTFWNEAFLKSIIK